MAQKTELQVYTLPGAKHSFSAKTSAATTALNIIASSTVSPVYIADSGNNLLLGGDFETQGKVHAEGGFFPRILSQDGQPASGSGSQQINENEILFWRDTNDANRRYLVYNDGGTIIKVELT